MNVEFWDWVAMRGGDDDPRCDQCGERRVFLFVDWKIWLCGPCADNLTDEDIEFYDDNARHRKVEEGGKE